MFSNGTGNEQALVAHHTKIETSSEQAQEPYINISKRYKQNSINLDKQAKKSSVQNLNGLGKKEKSSAKKEMPTAFEDTKIKSTKNPQRNVIAKNEAISPTLQQVQEYFASQKSPAIEAEKFYNYFQSNGWLVGGRTKMKDWKAAAKNWMINANKFANSPSLKVNEKKQGFAEAYERSSGVVSKPKSKHLHTKQNKNYNEPL